jgi:uncharacterized protein
MQIHKLLLFTIMLSLVGCATQRQQLKMNESKEQFKQGNLTHTAASIEAAFPDKNALYYLEKGQTYRLLGPKDIPNSTQNFLLADQQVQKWEIETSDRISGSLNTVGSYFLAEGLSSNYDLKPYEMSLLSQYLSLNHISQGKWNDAMVEAKKMAQREKIIEGLIQKKVVAISDAQQNQQNNKKTQGSTTRIEEIDGYPVNLLDDDETRALKNAYQNPSAYYLSGFIYESQGETSLAAPGYRLALELRPSVGFFKSSLGNLEKNIKAKGAREDADTLVIIDTGFIPKISPFKANETFNLGNGPKIVTLTLPVIEKSTETFVPTNVQIGSQVLKPELVTNIDAMARKNLQDEMPGYVLRATSRAITSLATQLAIDLYVARSAENEDNRLAAALTGAVASLMVGATFQAINVTDARHWSTLPSSTYMTRVNLPAGPNRITYSTPSGAIQAGTVNLSPGYNVVYLRIFRDKGSLLTSNDPRALPANPSTVLLGPANTQPDLADQKKAAVPVSEGFFSGMLNFLIPNTAAKSEPISSPPEKVDNSKEMVQPPILDSATQPLNNKDPQ